ncbi:hypothetical protein B9J90_02875, partial [Vibrio sp. V09_P4A23P171]
MQPMVTDLTRRTLLKAALLSTSAPLLPLGCATTRRGPQPALIGCAINKGSQFRAVVADAQGQAIHQLPLPARGHGVAIHPT